MGSGTGPVRKDQLISVLVKHQLEVAANAGDKDLVGTLLKGNRHSLVSEAIEVAGKTYTIDEQGGGALKIRQ